MGTPLNAPAGSAFGTAGRPVSSGAAAALVLIGGLAVLMAVTVADQPGLLVLAPLAVAGAYACTRWPVFAVVSLFVLTGLANPLQAYFSLPARSVTNFALLSLWLGVIWAFTRTSDTRTWLWPGVLFPGLYLLLTALEIFIAPDFDAGFKSFQLAAFSISAFLLLALAPWPSATFRRIAQGVVAVALAVGLYGLFRFATGPSGEEQALARGALAGLPKGTELRFFGSFPTAQQLANWCATMVPFVLAIALVWRGKWGLAAAAAAGLGAFLLIAADVLTGVFALIAGLAVTLLLFGLAPAIPGGRRLAAAVLTVAAIALTASVGYTLTIAGSERSESKFSKLLDPTSDHTFQRRQDRWTEALAEIDEHPFGQGLGTVGAASARRTEIEPSVTPQLDSSYLKIALEQGMAVMVLFVLSLITLFVGLAQRVLTTTDPQRAALGMGACGALTSLMVLFFAGLYIDHLQALSGWLLVGIGVAQFTSRRQTEALQETAS
jgi:hypothetical protein